MPPPPLLIAKASKTGDVGPGFSATFSPPSLWAVYILIAHHTPGGDEWGSICFSQSLTSQENSYPQKCGFK